MSDPLPTIELDLQPPPPPRPHQPLAPQAEPLTWMPPADPTLSERLQERFSQSHSWTKRGATVVGGMLLVFLFWPVQRGVTVRGTVGVPSDQIIPLNSPIKGRVTRLAAPKDRMVQTGTPICWVIPEEDATTSTSTYQIYRTGSRSDLDPQKQVDSKMQILQNHRENVLGTLNRATNPDAAQAAARELERIEDAMRDLQYQNYQEYSGSSRSGGQTEFGRWEPNGGTQKGEVTIESPIDGFLLAHRSFGGATVAQQQPLAELIPANAPLKFEGGVLQRSASLVPSTSRVLSVHLNGEDKPLEGIQVTLLNRSPRVKDWMSMVDSPREFWDANWTGLKVQLKGTKVHELPLGRRIDLKIQSGYRPRIWHWWLNLIGA